MHLRCQIIKILQNYLGQHNSLSWALTDLTSMSDWNLFDSKSINKEFLLLVDSQLLRLIQLEMDFIVKLCPAGLES